MSRETNIFRTRTLLDSPYPSSPTLHQFVQAELRGEQDIVNQLNNTGKPWQVSTFELVSNSFQDTYEISANQFGKALYVVKATDNVQVPFVSVEFTDITDLTYGQVWNTAGSFYPNPTFEQFAFYRTAPDSIPMVKIQPLPQQQAVYTVSYLIGDVGTGDPLSASYAVPEYATLLQLRNAMFFALSGTCRWFEDDERNYAKSDRLAKAFAYELERKERSFAEYIRSLVHSQMVDCDADWR